MRLVKIMAKKKIFNYLNLQRKVEHFIASHKSTIHNVSRNRNNIFEVSCYVLVAQYYEFIGYRLEIKNPIDGKFRFRYSTNGFPWRYSYLVGFSKMDDQPVFEIWHNQKVAGFRFADEEENEIPLYATDIAIIKPRGLPANLNFATKGKDERVWVKNADLITFGEVKNLVGYPMLIAQFLGVVHEIKPPFLHESVGCIPSDFYEQRHLPPLLLTSGKLLSGALMVKKSFEYRQIEIYVIDNLIIQSFDLVLEELSKYSQQYTWNHQKEDLKTSDAFASN
jgi:hypothetical protein